MEEGGGNRRLQGRRAGPCPCCFFTLCACLRHAPCSLTHTHPHAAPADCPVDCRQPPYQLPTWPAAAHQLLDPATGRYTRQSDLYLVAALMWHLPFPLSDSGCDLRQRLATRQVPSAEAALQHEWLLQQA